ncbi:MAG TPA: type IV pilus twitching motility protein PilT [Gemmatimonadaceae bacterium]|jgi:twitching motility protein PilT|nr:type IV pilus twitching motility protein PilT [Gemmatimonadaceae bacterium]
MAQIDRLLAAMVGHRADGLHFVADEAVQLLSGTALRPLTRQAVSAAQLVALLREVAPSAAIAELDAERPVTFRYRTDEGAFLASAAREGGRWQATVRLDDGSAGTPDPAPASPAAPDLGPIAAYDAGPVSGAEQGAAPVVTEERHDGDARNAMEALLRVLAEAGGSDLHLRCGEPPMLRKDGELVRLEAHATLENGPLEAMLFSIMPARNRGEFAQVNDTDFAHEILGVGRFRANALRDRRGAAAVFRMIAAGVVTVEQMGIPPAVQALCQLSRGLVLVTGPTGSGKSTTLCSLIDLVNRSRSDHIITIEDPIEFVHANKRCLITQRQVGVHTSSFKSALRAALREDPDIVLVGELRDLETVSIAIETAETGHLVFGTLHTTTAAGTVDRIIDQFPADRQEQIRVMLAESLKGVISQTLCRKVGGGRVAAREVLLSIPAVSNLIREGKTFQLPSVIQTSRRLGMTTLNDALLEHVDAGVVEPAEAYAKAQDKTGLAAALRTRGHDVSFAEPDEPKAAASAGTKTGATRAVGR